MSIARINNKKVRIAANKRKQSEFADVNALEINRSNKTNSIASKFIMHWNILQSVKRIAPTVRVINAHQTRTSEQSSHPNSYYWCDSQGMKHWQNRTKAL